QETRYLLRVVNAHFRQQLQEADVLWSYAGVRALADDTHGKAQAASRDYTLAFDQPPGLAPMTSVPAGTSTTHRRLPAAGAAPAPPLDRRGRAARRRLCRSRHPGSRPAQALPLAAGRPAAAFLSPLRHPDP